MHRDQTLPVAKQIVYGTEYIRVKIQAMNEADYQCFHNYFGGKNNTRSKYYCNHSDDILDNLNFCARQ